MQQKSRITLLDSFRFFAILSVMLYHYYSRWTPPQFSGNLYPYGNKYSVFSYGYLGVQFFFIISGFVIAYTLYATDQIWEFWKKRIIRLFPPMFICSLITLLVFTFSSGSNLFPESHSLTNFLGSLTFISPKLIEKISDGHIKFEYINGSYWSLWTEIQFYIISSLVFYARPDKFVRNFSILSIFIYALFWLIENINGHNMFHIQPSSTIFFITSMLDTFDISKFILYFFTGILFFGIYSKKYDKYTIIILILVVLLLLHSTIRLNVRIGMVCMICLFFLFIYFPSFLNLLNHKLITNIGLASYTLYLIHENIGVLLIHKYAMFWGRFDFLFPVFVIILCVAFSLVSYRYIEKPINKFLKRKFLS
jgi:peptidoglycan/LPS O-acetylase OafA/YrhL